eukprot:scaffold792_cov38-Prasinocladus_malaysianus.AAC.1
MGTLNLSKSKVNNLAHVKNDIAHSLIAAVHSKWTPIHTEPIARWQAWSEVHMRGCVQCPQLTTQAWGYGLWTACLACGRLIALDQGWAGTRPLPGQNLAVQLSFGYPT